MLEIILLVVGIFKLIKRPRLKKLSATDFPDVTPEKFAEWKKTELTATDVFLWATWGAFLIKIAIMIALGEELERDTALGISIAILVLWFIGLIIAASFGSKARKIREAIGINKDFQPIAKTEA